jgi:hypothetical protein
MKAVIASMVVEPSSIAWCVAFLIKEEKKRRRDYSQKNESASQNKS